MYVFTTFILLDMSSEKNIYLFTLNSIRILPVNSSTHFNSDNVIEVKLDVEYKQNYFREVVENRRSISIVYELSQEGHISQ